MIWDVPGLMRGLAALRRSLGLRDSDGGRPAAFNQRLWFGITGFGVISLLGVAFALLITHFVSSQMLQREAVVTREFLESIIRAEDSGARIFEDGPVGGNVQLASFVGHIRGMPDVLRANIYARDRSILWSTDSKLIGQRFSANPELEEAFGDELVTEVGELSGDSKEEHVDLGADARGVFLEAYIPIRSGGRVIGVVELYKVPTALDRMIREGRIIIWLSVAAGAMVSFLALFWIVRRGALLIEGQQAELGRMEAMAAVGQMAGAIAHSLRNPMAGIRSSAELLRLEAPERSAVSDEIIGEVDRLDGCVRELLNYTRSETLALQSVDPAALVSATLAREETALVRGRIRVEVADTRGVGRKIRVDPQLLGQALTSIITNAIEAMGEGGVLSVRLDVGGGMVVLQFADSGPGIEAEILARVSEPFFTTKTRGLGLGLALARRIIERFRGRLEITSQAGSGAVVRVLLPAI